MTENEDLGSYSSFALGPPLIYLALRLNRELTKFVNAFVKTRLSYDVSGIQWITSCHKNCMTTRVITLWRVDVMSFATPVSTMRFLLEILSILKAIKFNFKGSYDKQNLTLVVFSYEIYETHVIYDHSCKILYIYCRFTFVSLKRKKGS